ncbi:rRNA maturation RNase YbeY [Gynurincola endophyticus]|jgi:probable rRNA maturation factor|uniref:rRNA maturation RNase YbeY n=1 Tax=Gynurincola endophyticus TaxID=2479004 RepID=UPI000F8E9D4F|nr:rRNA maturation RNase YbeY [Gynurincola endophyticus]
MSKISFHSLKATPLKNKTALKNFLQQLFEQENKSLHQLTYIFCDDDYLLEINKNHLQHDYYTDIITFDLSENDEDGTIGELYLSIDRIRDNAKQMNQPLERELHRVIFHGALHLCGYKDKTDKEEKLMREMEDKYLNQYLK